MLAEEKLDSIRCELAEKRSVLEKKKRESLVVKEQVLALNKVIDPIRELYPKPIFRQGRGFIGKVWRLPIKEGEWESSWYVCPVCGKILTVKWHIRDFWHYRLVQCVCEYEYSETYYCDYV